MDHESPYGDAPVLEGVIPGTPPSANNMYGKRRGGGRFLLPAVKTYKNEGVQALGMEWALKPALPTEALYRIDMTFVLPENLLINKSFGKKGGAKTRYKRIDLSGFVKAPEDVVVLASGVDDSLFCAMRLEKRSTNEDVGWTEVKLWKINDPNYLKI